MESEQLMILTNTDETLILCIITPLHSFITFFLFIFIPIFILTILEMISTANFLSLSLGINEIYLCHLWLLILHLSNINFSIMGQVGSIFIQIFYQLFIVFIFSYSITHLINVMIVIISFI